MNALDVSNESTCWNSDGQADGDIDLSFVINFHRTVLIEELKIQFQGGFVSEECSLYTAAAAAAATTTTTTSFSSCTCSSKRKLQLGISH